MQLFSVMLRHLRHVRNAHLESPEIAPVEQRRLSSLYIISMRYAMNGVLDLLQNAMLIKVNSQTSVYISKLLTRFIAILLSIYDSKPISSTIVMNKWSRPTF